MATSSRWRSLKGRNVVLVFYPADDTSVCTKQLCEFRDRWPLAQQKNTVVFGVNPGKNHAQFRDKFQFPFPLLFDKGQKVGAAYQRGADRAEADGVSDRARRNDPLRAEGKAGAGRGAGGGGMITPAVLSDSRYRNRGATRSTLRTRPRGFSKAALGILQFRHKEFWSRDVFEQLEHIAELCRDAGVVVGRERPRGHGSADRRGIASGAGRSARRPSRDAFWERLRSDSPRIMKRNCVPPAEEPADYLALGPIFGTASKANPDPMVGLDGLRRLRPLTGRRPLVAIGGITRENARAVLDAGADSVAVIGDLFPEDGDIVTRV